MQKNNNKIYKYLIVIALCFVVLVSSIVVLAMEFTDDPQINQHTFGDFIVKNMTINIYGNADGTYRDLVDRVTVSKLDSYEGGVRFELKLTDKFSEYNKYTFSLTMRVPDHIYNSKFAFLGSYDIWLRRNGEFAIDDVITSYRHENYSGVQYSKWKITSFDNFPTVRVTYDTQAYNSYYLTYYTQFTFTATQSTDTLYCYLANYNMALVDPNEELKNQNSSNTSSIVSNNNANTSKVQSSISQTQSVITNNITSTQSAITSNNNSNTSKVQSSIAETESNIKANQDKNASDIQSNADKNTSDTISNSNKNHEEMLRGEEYDKMDGQSVDDYKNAESQLNAATSQAQSDSISFLNTFGSIFNGKHVTKGLLSVSAIFKEFFAVSWLSEVLTFGLGLGIFGFILGTVSMVVRSHGSKEAQSKNFSKSKKGGGS